jgi:demethylspheroidene O-methyltransferase
MLLSHTILNYVDLSRSRHLLDIGGSQGLFSAAVLTRYPTIRSTIFEPQQVRPTTRKQIEDSGLADRVDVVGGDFIDDPWPRGHDVVAFIRIFTTRTPEVIEGLLTKAFDSLPSGGLVMFADTAVLPAGRGQVGPLAARMAQIYQMASPGDVRGIDEWSAMMTNVGFAEPFVAVLEDPYGLLVARKP